MFKTTGMIEETEKDKFLWTCPICDKNLYSKSEKQDHKCELKVSDAEYTNLYQSFVSEHISSINGAKTEEEVNKAFNDFNSNLNRYEKKIENSRIKEDVKIIKHNVKSAIKRITECQTA